MEVYSFSKEDIKQLKKHGLSEKQVFKQLDIFKKGIPFANIVSPASLDNGIIQLNENSKAYYIDIYEKTSTRPVKFVPASGAATRMFKLLHQFIQKYNPNEEDLNTFLKTDKFKALNKFFDQIQNLPFYDTIETGIKKIDSTYETDNNDVKKYKFVYFLINEIRLAELPKGLIPFHKYEDKILTAFDEHFNEAVSYINKDGKINLHFTVAKEHTSRFKKAAKKASKLFKGYDFDISYSFQSKSTDTIAVDKNNLPFRDKEGKLLFRPGGHGALIQNLNQIEADLIFIKNIDNVVPEKNIDLVSSYKKALGGILLETQNKIFEVLSDMDKNGYNEKIRQKAEDVSLEFLHKQQKFTSEDDIRDFFDRPLRVCGMVENKGEPGGGPFWIKDENDEISLQIIESAQIDIEDPKVEKLMEKVTHFNPVDLVCGIYDYQGNKYDLQEFVAPNQGFITHKSVDGKPLKALELPGLWNGAMAYWNTIFVEVPHQTFNPVKTVIDLLRPEHQTQIVKVEK